MSFNLTRKTDYALVALAKLAKEKLTTDGKPLSARVLADQHHLPLPLLMNALKELHRAGVIDSRRGANGGYFLARDPEAISLREIIEALEGSIKVTLCSDESQGETQNACCDLLQTCIISEPIRRINVLLNEFLQKISLKDIVNQDLGEANYLASIWGAGVRV